MTNTEVTIHVLARLQALEYLVGHLLAWNFKQADLTVAQATAFKEATLSNFVGYSVQGIEAAQSDHFAAECEAAVTEVLDRAIATLAAVSET